MSPTFGIMIATYGDREWERLANERALPSAIMQKADEILIDHFPDASIAEARNELASRSQSDYLVFLDADDELQSKYVTFMRKAVEGMTFYEGKRVILVPRVSYVKKGRPAPPRFPPRRGTLEDDNYIVVGAGIQRWDFLDVGGFSNYPHGFEDWSLWAKSWKAGATVVDVPRSVYIAHVNPNSKHRTAWRDRTWQVNMHERVRRELFPEKYA